MAPHAEEVIHPEELSRRISEIDLTNLRRRADTVTGNPPRYTPTELLQIRPSKSDESNVPTFELAEGMKTPNTVPKPPPPTPNNHPGSPAALDLHEDVEPGQNAITVGELAVDGVKKKKKKSKSKGGKKKAPAPTGFEEFYADPPISPDEYDEESDLYAVTRPFHERIQTCIQRYRKKRNLDSVRANIFTKYLMLGGVEASTNKAFTGGLDQETLDNANAEEIAAIQATDHIRIGGKNAKYYDPSEPEKWVVDFEGIAKGFLSHTFSRRFGFETEAEIKQVCAVIRNFLNYILSHGVCPEYTKDVLAARKICDTAEKELWAIRQLQPLLPGDFNVAASTLYGGHYQAIRILQSDWISPQVAFEGSISINHSLTDGEAERIFKTAIAFAGSEELFLEAMKGTVEVVNSEIKFFEIVNIDRASIQTIEEYGKVRDLKGEASYVKPLGVIHVKSWEGPNLDEEDFTDDESEGEIRGFTDSEEEVQSFWMEDTILQHLYVGLRVEVAVKELNIGVKFFDRVLGLYCSYYTTLPNEKVIEFWKEPVPNNRPPPTEDDPDIEEEAMARDEENDLDYCEKDFGVKKIEVNVAEIKQNAQVAPAA